MATTRVAISSGTISTRRIRMISPPLSPMIPNMGASVMVIPVLYRRKTSERLREFFGLLQAMDLRRNEGYGRGMNGKGISLGRAKRSTIVHAIRNTQYVLLQPTRNGL